MSNFWTDKKIVVTGGAALIGSELVKQLLQLPIGRLIVVDDLSSGKLENLKEFYSDYRFSFRKFDLRYYDIMRQAVGDADVVFHLAAQHGGRTYVDSHSIEFYQNIGMDQNVFKYCCESGVEKIVYMSSACAYPLSLQSDINQNFYLNEHMIDYNNIRQPDGHYGLSKLLGEISLNSYVNTGKIKGCSVRGFTVYGNRVMLNHAIGALIAKSLIRQQPFQIYGDGNQKRNWTHVSDTCKGLIMAAEKLDQGAVNIGTEEINTPNSACQIIWNRLNWKPKTTIYSNQFVGPLNRVADASRAISLGWKPSLSFEDGLNDVIDYFVLKYQDKDELKFNLQKEMFNR